MSAQVWINHRNLRIPAEADQGSCLIPITIPA